VQSGHRRLWSRSVVIVLSLAIGATIAGFQLSYRLAEDDPSTALPDFRMAALADPERKLGPEDFTGEIALLNVWATWCAPCRQEHPLLLEISEAGTTVYGINFTDDREAALHWLNSLGNPYAFNVFDQHGQLALALGVYGVPETYLLDASGRIRYKHQGLLDEQTWEQEFLPRIQRLRTAAESPS